MDTSTRAAASLLATAVATAVIGIAAAATANAAPNDDSTPSPAGPSADLAGSPNLGKASPGQAVIAHSEFLTRFPPGPIVPPHPIFPPDPIQPRENFNDFAKRFFGGIENPDN